MFLFHAHGRVLKACLTALTGVALLLSSLPAAAQVTPDKTFEDWATGTFSSDDAKRYVICRTNDSKNTSVSLELVKEQPACGNTRMLIFVSSSTPISKDAALSDIEGELRVDEAPIRATKSSIREKKGKTYSTIEIDSFQNPKTLLQEMSTGQTVRIHFKINGTEHYYRFSLKGFGQAFERIGHLCSASGGPAPKAGGQKPAGAPKGKKPPKSDSDFFDDKKPAKSDKDFF